MKKSELKQLIREEIQKSLKEMGMKPSLDMDKEIIKGIIGKTILDSNTGDEMLVTGIEDIEEHPHGYQMVDLTVKMNDGYEGEIVLDIESIMDLLIGKTAAKFGFDQLSIKKGEEVMSEESTPNLDDEIAKLKATIEKAKDEYYTAKPSDERRKELAGIMGKAGKELKRLNREKKTGTQNYVHRHGPNKGKSISKK